MLYLLGDITECVQVIDIKFKILSNTSDHLAMDFVQSSFRTDEAFCSKTKLWPLVLRFELTGF